MRNKLFVSMTALVLLALPLAAQAQGTVRGAQEGAEEGGRAAGPLGAVVGGTVGAAVGTVGEILGVEDRPRFREYVVRERIPFIPLRAGTPRRYCVAQAGSHLL